MSDPAFAGHCLSCGNPTYGQAECDACSNWNGLYPCPECQNDIPHEECRNDEQPKRCLDHMDKDELYEEAVQLTDCNIKLAWEIRELKSEIEENNSCIRYKEAHIAELEAQSSHRADLIKDSLRIIERQRILIEAYAKEERIRLIEAGITEALWKV